MSVKINWLKTVTSSAAQVYGMGMQYSFVSAKLDQCTPFVFCKDFLQDSMWGMINGKKASIYGFSYSPTEKPALCLDKTRIMIVKSNDKDFTKKIPNILDFINQFCIKLHMKKTTVEEVSNPPKKFTTCGAWLFDGSARWQSAPPLLSMYTLMMRIGPHHKIGDDCLKTLKNVSQNASVEYTDKHQVSQAMPSILNIIKLGYRKFFYIDSKKNFPVKADISSMHNNTGICAMASTNVVPYWHRKSISKLLKEKK